MMASMTMSHPANSSKVVVPVRFARVGRRTSSGTFPFATPSSRNLRMRPSPLSRKPCSTSRTTVLNPLCAAIWAIPAPISPHPRTPTVLMA